MGRGKIGPKPHRLAKARLGLRQLAAQGFSRAFTLRGGLAAWRADNLPVSRA